MVGLVAAQAAAVNPDSNNLWNAGTLNTSGGNSTTAGGGDGGDTYLYLDVNRPDRRRQPDQRRRDRYQRRRRP